MGAIAEVIAKLHTLPSPRGVALELMQLAQREDATITDVARIVQADPALAGRLIQAANRLNGGQMPRTGVLREAVLRLGFPATRQIALGFSLVNDYRSGHCPAFDYSAFWAGSLMRGLAAQAVAARIGKCDPQEALVCGLLVDIGRLALATAQPRAYADILEQKVDDGAGLRRAERESFGTDHAELCIALLERWSLPEAQVLAIREFHAVRTQMIAQGASLSRRVWIMVLAEALAQGAVASAPQAWKQVALDAATRLGLDTDALNGLAADMVRELSAWAPLMDLPVPAAVVTDYAAYERPGPEAAGSHRPLNILVVDDSEDDRDLVRYTLEAAGHHVHAVSSADAALAAIAATLPELVLTDWEMPGMNGVALCRALRATRLGKGLYVIMYTGHSSESELVAAIEAGADDFMSKPASAEVLLARVNAGARGLRHTVGVAGEFLDARRMAVSLAVGGPL